MSTTLADLAIFQSDPLFLRPCVFLWNESLGLLSSLMNIFNTRDRNDDFDDLKMKYF